MIHLNKDKEKKKPEDDRDFRTKIKDMMQEDIDKEKPKEKVRHELILHGSTKEELIESFRKQMEGLEIEE